MVVHSAACGDAMTMRGRVAMTVEANCTARARGKPERKRARGAGRHTNLEVEGLDP
jgi:hypothetical protein